MVMALAGAIPKPINATANTIICKNLRMINPSIFLVVEIVVKHFFDLFFPLAIINAIITQ